MLPTVCLIACHGGPADHFATFAEKLTAKGYTVQIYAAEGPALDKFKERKITVHVPFSLKNLGPEEINNQADLIAKTASKASIVITDVGHVFDVHLQKSLAIHAAEIPHLAYYDNPEPFVPGGYSETAAEIMENAESTIFAKASLAEAKIYRERDKEVDFVPRKRFGLGYTSLSKAEEIEKRRETDKTQLRADFFAKNKLEDKNQKILAYFGGNNSDYFTKAFPAFLDILAKTSGEDFIVLIHQHPGAKTDNLDLKKLAEYQDMPTIIVSDYPNSDPAQILADIAFYYQTSMTSQFALEGLPTVQIGHNTYEDMLIINKLAPSVTTATQFAAVLENPPQRCDKELVLKIIEYRKDWFERFEKAIQDSILAHKK